MQNLNKRQKWLTPRRNLTIGDVVIICEDNVPRNKWPLAQVIEVFSGKDGLVRHVKLQLGSSSINDKGKRTSDLTVLERPIQKLVVLFESEE